MTAPSGWRNVEAVPEQRRFADASGEATVCYRPLRDGRVSWGSVLTWLPTARVRSGGTSRPGSTSCLPVGARTAR